MERKTHDLILDVMDGNPGAFIIIRTLMGYPTWLQLLVHLKRNDLVGSELWRTVKDEYGHNIVAFIHDQLQTMPLERASALRALTHQRSPIYN